jgi:hypothetical protein
MLSSVHLRPQDILILLKLGAHPGARLPQITLARELGMSAGEVSGALRRSVAARLAARSPEQGPRPIYGALEEFLIHGVRYAFPAEEGAITRGMPTAWAAPPLANELAGASDAPAPVWPDPRGEVRGAAVEPLYRSVPKAARLDAALYELLALVDAIRIGRARERKLAESLLRSRLQTAR